MMRRKAWMALPLVLALATQACSSSAPSGSGAGGAGTDGKVTISYWNHINKPSNDYEAQLIDEYQKANPNVTINYLTVNDADMQTKLTTALVGGSGPDLVNQDQMFMPALVAHGDIVPVDLKAVDIADNAAFEQKYSAPIAKGYSIDGTIYGVPFEVSSYAFWANGASFEKAGLDPVADFPKTYTDLIRVGKKLQETGAAKEGISLTLYAAGRDLIQLDAMARQAGGSLVSEDGKTPQLDTAPVAKALQMWADLARVEKINDPTLGPTASTNAEDLFGNGTAAMVNTGGSWLIGVLKAQYPEVYAKYTVGQWPTFEGGPSVGGDLYGYALMVTKQSKNQAEAWKFAKFMTDHAADYFTNTGIWLGDAATLNSDATKTFPHWDVFAESYARGFFLPPIVKTNEFSQIVSRAVQRAVLNGDPVETVLSDAQKEAVPLFQ